MRGFIGGVGRALLVLTVIAAAGLATGCGGNNNPSGGGGYTGGDTTGGNNTGGNNTGGGGTDSTVSNVDTLIYGGQKYRTVLISGKIWMAENLNFPTSSGSFCYNGSQDNCAIYGKLYNWATAKTACPAGWRLPSRREWGDLAIAAGGTGEYGTGGEAGYKLKASDGWNQGGDGGDAFGFSALPGGRRYYTESSGWNYAGINNIGYWWTATEYSNDNTYFRRMDYNGGFVIEENQAKNHYMSVRCVKNP
jgi:uncharacterized protein (TIGR02145 family)